MVRGGQGESRSSGVLSEGPQKKVIISAAFVSGRLTAKRQDLEKHLDMGGGPRDPGCLANDRQNYEERPPAGGREDEKKGGRGAIRKKIRYGWVKENCVGAGTGADKKKFEQEPKEK